MSTANDCNKVAEAGKQVATSSVNCLTEIPDEVFLMAILFG